MLKIRDPNIRAIVSGIISILSFFFWMWCFGVYQDNMTLRQEMIAAKPAVLVCLVLSAIAFFTVAFATKLDSETIEQLEVEISVSENETKVRADIKRMQQVVDDLPTSDPMVEKIKTIIEVVREIIKNIKVELESEDMSDAQDLMFLTKETADGIETYREQLRKSKMRSEFKAKAQESRDKMPVILLGFLTLLDKVSPDTEENTALKQVEMKMRAWGYISQLEELALKRKTKQGDQS